MACFETGTVVSLSPREAITLPHLAGATVRVTRGTVWLTEERDRSDIVLRAGDNWLVESDGATVVEAYDGAVFCVVGRKAESLELPARARAPGTLLAALASFFALPRQVPYA